MRDFALTRAIDIQAALPSNLLGRLLVNWRDRRRIGKLGHFDDHMLKDIGITRADLVWASHLPLSINPGIALQEQVGVRERKAAFTSARRA